MAKTRDQLIAAGTYRPDRHSNRITPPSAGPLGDPPSHLAARHKKVWLELVDNCAPGVLQKSDRHILEALSFLISAMREEPSDISATQAATLSRLLGALGMTPESRGRISVAPPEPAPNDTAERFFND